MRRRPRRYEETAQQRIRQEFARTPSVQQDATSTWSLSTLQKVLRNSPDALPAVSPHTLWQVLKEEGYSHQNDRTWCETGTLLRKRTLLRRRKEGIVAVTDPDTDAKKD